jgi:acyl carrier protein
MVNVRLVSPGGGERVDGGGRPGGSNTYWGIGHVPSKSREVKPPRLAPDTEAFVDLVCEEFELDRRPRLDEDLVEEVGLDSLDLFHLVVFLEELAGIDEPEVLDGAFEYPVLTSLQDAYSCLCELLNLEALETERAEPDRVSDARPDSDPLPHESPVP